MRIALFQQDIEWNAPAENMRRAEAAFEACFGGSSEAGGAGETDVAGKAGAAADECGGLRSAVRPDLLVLPEMFSTGFCAERSAAAAASDTLEWMRRMAARYDAAVAGSVAVEDEGRYYNRFCFVKPDGGAEFYDKRHLFSFGGEGRHYTAGARRMVVEWRGVRFLLQVCYDLRFPVFARNRGDYDVILYTASWPMSRIGAWDVLLRARAIENQCYVAGVNRTGRDPQCRYCGHTAAIDPFGREMAACGDGVRTITMDVDMEFLRGFRRKFPVLGDRDEWSIEL